MDKLNDKEKKDKHQLQKDLDTINKLSALFQEFGYSTKEGLLKLKEVKENGKS